MATADPILDLSTLIQRPPIRVDGVIYHLKSSDELTLLESMQFTTWGNKLKELGEAPDKVAELKALVDDVAWAAISDMPKAVFKKLKTVQRMQVVEVFTGLLLGRRMALAGAIVGTFGQQTGASSSPGSSSPSAARPTGGSTKRRRRS